MEILAEIQIVNSVGTLLDAEDFSRDAATLTDMIQCLREGNALRVKSGAKWQGTEKYKPR